MYISIVVRWSGTSTINITERIHCYGAKWTNQKYKYTIGMFRCQNNVAIVMFTRHYKHYLLGYSALNPLWISLVGGWKNYPSTPSRT